MNKKTLRIIIYVLAILIIAEFVVIVINHHSDKTDLTEGSAGQIQISDTIITVNDTQIPSFNYNEELYIAAEDLHNFGIDMITNSDESISLIHDDSMEFKSTDGIDREYSNIPDGSKVTAFNAGFTIKGKSFPCYTAYDYHLIPLEALKNFGTYSETDGHVSIILGQADNSSSSSTTANAAQAQGSTASQQQAKVIEGSENAKNRRGASINNQNITEKKTVIVLDPGHGKSSGEMSSSEMEASGYVYNNNREQWGEWRHWKSGTTWIDCEGSGCSGRHPEGGSCWYSASSGDRDIEPEINLNNSLAAKKYLEQMGYEVRLTRSTNDENPSITKRLQSCYPNGDITKDPDAAIFLCVHSNAGGGRGSAYISLSGEYDQKGISSSYATDGNNLGKAINDRIIAQTSLQMYSNGIISSEPQLIAFCKSPVTCGYIEIGFFDNTSDLNILRNESDKIGQSIAEGIDDYLKSIQ